MRKVMYGIKLDGGSWYTSHGGACLQTCSSELPAQTYKTQGEADDELSKLVKTQFACHADNAEIIRITLDKVNSEPIHKLCLFHNVDWIPQAFEAQRVVFYRQYQSTWRKSITRLHKTRLEVIDATHVRGQLHKHTSDGYKFLDGVWHVSEIDASHLVRVCAYTSDYGTLLNEFTKPGVMLPA